MPSVPALTERIDGTHPLAANLAWFSCGERLDRDRLTGRIGASSAGLLAVASPHGGACNNNNGGSISSGTTIDTGLANPCTDEFTVALFMADGTGTQSSPVNWFTTKIVVNVDQGGTGNAGWAVTINGGKPQLVIWDSLMTAATAINDNTWHTIVFTRSGANGTVYLDGVQDGSSSALTSSSVSNAQNVWLLKRTSQNGTDGSVGLFALWTRALGHSEVASFTSDPYAMFRTRRRYGRKGLIVP